MITALLHSVIMMTAPAVRAQTGYTLEDCFKAAVKRSETIATQTELIEQAEERYVQARAFIFPTINGVASYLVQPSSSTNTSLTPSEQTTVKVTGSQPIFSGLKEYAGILQANLQVTGAMEAKRQAATALYTAVAANYYQILQLEQDLRNVNNVIEIDQQQIVELNARVKIGRSRITDVLTVKTAVDTLEATAENDRGQILAARETFAFLTGFDRNAPLREAEVAKAKLDPLPAYLSHIEDRPDVKAAKDNVEATEENVPIARAGHFPIVALNAEYFFKRPGISSDQHWDATITGTLPLFAGGAIDAQVRQAVSQTRAADLALSLARRTADENIRTVFSNLTSDTAQVDRLERATKTAHDTYEAQKHDFRLGLVTILDVLTSINNFETAQQTLDKIRYQLKLDSINMDIAVARKPDFTNTGI